MKAGDHFATPNAKAGPCRKCGGTGSYVWGPAASQNVGTCFACRGTGRQSRSDIHRNLAYNRAKIERGLGKH